MTVYSIVDINIIHMKTLSLWSRSKCWISYKELFDLKVIKLKQRKGLLGKDATPWWSKLITHEILHNSAHVQLKIKSSLTELKERYRMSAL